MPRIDFIKKNLGRVDLGRGRRTTPFSPTADCLTHLSKVSMGNIDKDGRYWQGEIEISVDISSYHGSVITLAAMSAGEKPSLKSSLHFKVEDDFENLV